MDHGTDPAFETCRFYKTFTVNRAVDLIQASCKFLRSCLDSLSCFNSPVRLAVAAAGIGAVANTLRLELVDLANIPPAAAAFIGALTAGLLASLLKNKVGYPRISVTVPSIAIMVPGLYLYRGFL